MPSLAYVAALGFLAALQRAPIDGTWQLTRIFRTARLAAVRALPLDSTVSIRLTLESHPGGWISGWLQRRYHGVPERSKVEAGPLDQTGRYIIAADFERPVSTKVRAAAWLVRDTLRLGPAFVPGADSLELARVRPDAPDPATIEDVVTRP